ncbi:hypothetical protein Tco_0184209 [Tanacetum coccineum]
MSYDSSLSGGYTPRSDEGSKKLNELTKLCTKLSEKVTSLEQDIKQTKQVYGKALTKLVKKVKHLEDQLKSTTKRRKAKVVISDKEEDLVSKDPSKQGRMLETKYEDVETEHAEEVEYGDILQQITPLYKDMLPEKRLSKATPKEEVLTVQKVRDVTEAYQSFEDMLKGFDREDLVELWSLVKERFRSAEPTEDMEKALWVELKRLFEPDKDDVLWKLQRYMHDPLTWRLYGSCGVHHISSTRGHDIYMLTEKRLSIVN